MGSGTPGERNVSIQSVLSTTFNWQWITSSLILSFLLCLCWIMASPQVNDLDDSIVVRTYMHICAWIIVGSPERCGSFFFPIAGRSRFFWVLLHRTLCVVRVRVWGNNTSFLFKQSWADTFWGLRRWWGAIGKSLQSRVCCVCALHANSSQL